MRFYSDIQHRQRLIEESAQAETAMDRWEHPFSDLARLYYFKSDIKELWPRVVHYAQRTGMKTLTLLDLACGNGERLVALWRKGQKAGLSLNLEAWETNAQALARAQAHAQAARAELLLKHRDPFDGPLPPTYDIVICSLYLHRLSDVEAIRLLQRIDQATRGVAMVDDLLRSRMGLFLAWFGSGFRMSSDLIRQDVMKSVHAAFSLPEVQELARRAGLDHPTLATHWTRRFLLSWERP